TSYDNKTRRRVLNGMLSILIDPQRLGTADAFARDARSFLDWLRQSRPAPSSSSRRKGSTHWRAARAARRRVRRRARSARRARPRREARLPFRAARRRAFRAPRARARFLHGSPAAEDR